MLKIVFLQTSAFFTFQHAHLSKHNFLSFSSLLGLLANIKCCRGDTMVLPRQGRDGRPITNRNPNLYRGLPITVRVTVKHSEGGSPMDRGFFTRRILLKACGFQATEIFTLHDSRKGGYFDVTFKRVADCVRLLRVFEEKRDLPEMKILTAEPHFSLPLQREREVMVHVYNPFVPVADVVTFLTRYFDKVGSGTEIRDDLGIWTGKRLFKVTLKTDGKGAIFHPPSSFAIGGNRGYLVYAGQPKHCRSCGKAGHVAANCSASLCKICKQEGHQTKDCKQAKCCNLCGEASHLYRTCPKRCRTYAQAAKADQGEAEEMFRVTPTTKAPRQLNGTKEDTERDKVEKEIEATESQSTALPPEPPSPQDSESMEEEAAVEKQQGEWQTVKNKNKKRTRPAMKQRSERQLSQSGPRSGPPQTAHLQSNEKPMVSEGNTEGKMETSSWPTHHLETSPASFAQPHSGTLLPAWSHQYPE
ncbi:uncharacterized protein LOC144668732 [Cetorhinus maximus]